jgi:hypothetical protein
MIRLLHERSLFSERFMAHLFNSSEKRSSNTAGACTFTVLYSTSSCMGEARR